MKQSLILVLLTCTILSCQELYTVEVPGLTAPVKIVRDKWGINHIYAENQRDLFFAQGFAAARDRLFQFEIWRRQATGTVAEILGERELKRDIGTRLFMFRGDMTEEMNHYHDDGEEIITAYVEGVNAYIDDILERPEDLPMEFKLLAIKPEKWTPEVVISRHQGLLGNIGSELSIGRSVALVGADKVKELRWFHPKDPVIELDSTINKESLMKDVLGLYNAFRTKVVFEEKDIIPEYRPTENIGQLAVPFEDFTNEDYSVGSNNWVIRGDLMEDGNTYMANDPHRTIAVPSLRYMAHLVAPGWNVIGGGEPEIPGISIGHNEYGAWGLTVFRTDGEDLYVYDLNPKNLNQYWYKGEWIDMDVKQETISVKNSSDKEVELRYTRHGPVTFIDSANNKGYAIRCAWLEPGGSPYLASLRMDQSKTWEEFREACNYSHIPGENMVWADKEGNIGWQAVGIAPIRRNFSGMVPIPGDGRYEWDGYLPIIQKPNVYNPNEGFFATANQNVTPEDYEHWDAIAYQWSDPYRGDRVNEVLSAGQKMNMQDMISLQTDYTSLPARTLVPYLLPLTFSDSLANKAQSLLENWNFELNPESIPAAIYVTFENNLRIEAHQRFVPMAIQQHITSIQLKRVIDWVISPDDMFGSDAIKGRNRFLQETFETSISELVSKLGPNMDNWQYGQEDLKHVLIRHAVSDVTYDEIDILVDAGPAPRGGNGYTPGSTSNNWNQSTGASFRMIVNTGDWDEAIGTNPPGQSGDPNSPFYSNLFDSWANDEYFPVFYSKAKIDSVAVETLRLEPRR